MKSSPPTLTMNDIQTMASIVRVATKRGAFEPAELSEVGSLYDRLILFIDHMKTTSAASESADSAASESADSAASASADSAASASADSAASESAD